MKTNEQEEQEFRSLLKAVQDQYYKQLEIGIECDVNPLRPIFLSATEIATLKHVFDDAKLKTMFCQDNGQYEKYCNLYKTIYLQVKADNFLNT